MILRLVLRTKPVRYVSETLCYESVPLADTNDLAPLAAPRGMGNMTTLYPRLDCYPRRFTATISTSVGKTVRISNVAVSSEPILRSNEALTARSVTCGRTRSLHIGDRPHDTDNPKGLYMRLGPVKAPYMPPGKGVP